MIVQSLADLRAEIEQVSGRLPDHRGVMYLLAKLQASQEAVRHMTHELEIERKVNTKLSDIFKDVFK